MHARSRHFYAERLRGFQDEDSPVAERAICTASPDWAGAFAAKRTIRFGSCNCACQCVHSPRGDSPKRSLHLRRIRRLWLDSWGGRVKQKSDYGRRQAYVLNSSTTAGCRICCPFWAFQNHRSLRYRTQGVIMLSRARYSCSWPGSNYPVMLDDCSAGPVSYTHLTLPTICSV